MNKWKTIMWKETLPINCPPDNAIELEIEVFRILINENPNDEDFKVYAKMYPDNPRYKDVCKAYALSFYNSLNGAKKTYLNSKERGNDIGNYIGSYLLIKDHGKHILNNESGHINTWFYNTWNLDVFNPQAVVEINED